MRTSFSEKCCRKPLRHVYSVGGIGIAFEINMAVDNPETSTRRHIFVDSVRPEEEQVSSRNNLKCPESTRSRLSSPSHEDSSDTRNNNSVAFAIIGHTGVRKASLRRIFHFNILPIIMSLTILTLYTLIFKTTPLEPSCEARSRQDLYLQENANARNEPENCSTFTQTLGGTLTTVLYLGTTFKIFMLTMIHKTPRSRLIYLISSLLRSLTDATLTYLTYKNSQKRIGRQFDALYGGLLIVFGGMVLRFVEKSAAKSYLIVLMAVCVLGYMFHSMVLARVCYKPGPRVGLNGLSLCIPWFCRVSRVLC
mmetsp:Transcript_46555/g.53677  ORF Transcript_46555/g.53677 Transcript_46555/m.53677 type:complete len:308 (+) Transcript_46555:111-1034(+)